MQLDFYHNFKECWEQIEKVGKDYALAKAKSWHFQESVGAVKASIMSKMGDISVAKAEIVAKCDSGYLKHLKDTEAAIHEEMRLKATLDGLKTKFEAYRSLSSLEKAQINAEGH